MVRMCSPAGAIDPGSIGLVLGSLTANPERINTAIFNLSSPGCVCALLSYCLWSSRWSMGEAYVLWDNLISKGVLVGVRERVSHMWLRYIITGPVYWHWAQRTRFGQSGGPDFQFQIHKDTILISSIVCTGVHQTELMPNHKLLDKTHTETNTTKYPYPIKTSCTYWKICIYITETLSSTKMPNKHVWNKMSILLYWLNAWYWFKQWDARGYFFLIKTSSTDTSHVTKTMWVLLDHIFTTCMRARARNRWTNRRSKRHARRTILNSHDTFARSGLWVPWRTTPHRR